MKKPGHNLYLERYAYPESYLPDSPPEHLRMIVVIPAYKEPGLLDSLEALYRCHRTEYAVRIIVVVNQPEGDKEAALTNQKIYEEACAWSAARSTPERSFAIIWAKDLPRKHAGVGLARKIGMDEAVRQFEKLAWQQPHIHKKGVIVCFDADCQCDANYLTAIERRFKAQPSTPGSVVYFEHPLAGDLDDGIYRGIAKYELYLRYHVNAQRYAGCHYARQTVGSCMAVRSSVYQTQGGMNRKKAGEDFYFLQKLFPLKGFSEINDTCVIPSPRVSDRVPFGTGKAIAEWLENENNLLTAYHPRSYTDLKTFIHSREAIFELPHDDLSAFITAQPQSVRDFIAENGFEDTLKMIKGSSPTLRTFHQKFFHWLNGFQVLKFLHFARDHYYPSVEVEEAAAWLLEETFGARAGVSKDAKQLLIRYRRLDRASGWPN